MERKKALVAKLAWCQAPDRGVAPFQDANPSQTFRAALQRKRQDARAIGRSIEEGEEKEETGRPGLAGNDTNFGGAGAPCLFVLDALPDFSMQDRGWQRLPYAHGGSHGVVQSTLASKVEI